MDERQHLSVRRLHQHRRGNRHDREEGLDSVVPVHLHRPSDEKSALAAGRSGARYIAGGTTLVDLMRETVERPDAVVDINALPYRNVDLDGSALRIGSLVRMSDLAADRPGAARIPGHRTGIGAQRLGATAQHGLHRRQPDATPAVPVLPRRVGELQPPRAGHRVLGGRRTQPHPRHPRYQRPVRGHPSLRSGGRPGRARRGRRSPVTRPGDRRIPIGQFFRLAGDHPGPGARPAARRTDRRCRGADRARDAPVGLPEGPRQAVLRIRLDVCGGGTRHRRRDRTRGAGGRRRGGHGAVATARGRTGRDRARGVTRSLAHGRRSCRRRRQAVVRQRFQGRTGATRRRTPTQPRWQALP